MLLALFRLGGAPISFVYSICYLYYENVNENENVNVMSMNM